MWFGKALNRHTLSIRLIFTQQELLGPSFSIEVQEEANLHCRHGTCYCHCNYVGGKMKTCLAGCYYYCYDGEVVVVMELGVELILVVDVCI